MNRVFVLDTNKTPLAPCHPARAKELLDKGKASVYRMHPFTIILKYVVDDPQTDHLELKMDPGSKTTGMSIVSHGTRYTRVVFGLNIVHRGLAIVAKLLSRRQSRQSRRSRKTRYRQPRFSNRGSKGWIPPSTQSRIDNVATWLIRFMKWCGVSDIAIEIAKFDMHRMRKPTTKGKEYQQGTLRGYNVKEYLLQLHRHTCVYCKGTSKDRVLEIEHIIPKSKGGTNSITNLTLACRSCNRNKGALSLDQWRHRLPRRSLYHKALRERIPKVKKGIKPTLRNATVMNIVIPRILEVCDSLGLNITKAYGYQTKYNRLKQGYRKDHWIDSACVGDRGRQVYIPGNMKCLTATTSGHHNRQMQGTDKYGFPRTQSKGPSVRNDIRSGDIVKAVIPRGKYKGTRISRCTHYSMGITLSGPIYTNPKYCKVVQQKDGYRYHQGTATLFTFLQSDSNSTIKSMIGGTFKRVPSNSPVTVVRVFT